MCNWPSAENDITLTRELVNEELAKGWIFKFPGDLAAAQQAYPVGVAVGKLWVALSESRPPRLVVDQSICGLNSRCAIPEKSTLPTARDVLRCYPLRGPPSDVLGLSLDFKSAHKCVVIKESEQGLVGFSLEGSIYFYRVCPFGASFSASWWSRLGGFILRCMHQVIWWPHYDFLFVDDFLFYLHRNIMPISAASLCIFCLLCKVPLSWKKLELSTTITWIG